MGRAVLMLQGAILPRVAGWEARLEDVFAAQRTRPFRYGRSDCAIFVAQAVRALYPGFTWQPDWHNASTAMARLVAGGGLEAAVSEVLGPAHGDWRRCRRGDIALVEQQGRPALAVGTGMTVCGPAEPAGLAHLPRDRAVRVWCLG